MKYNSKHMHEVAEEVWAISQKDASISTLFDWLVNSDLLMKTTTVAFAATHANLEYYEAVDAFKSLEACEVGNFIVGRKGKESRFDWYYDPVSVALVGSSDMMELDPDYLEPVHANAIIDDGMIESINEIEHTFRLRENYMLLVNLPEDFDKSDLVRLKRWLDTLPFD
ncbi:hypothetical protein [Fretibacter rubidus]|uniref:hypothetical protein n=1 Tax=Fretibacter rubidus TaxID=570162 RepID=UPI00352AE445